MTEILAKYNQETKTYENTDSLVCETGTRLFFYNKTRVLKALGFELSVLDEDLTERVPLYKFKQYDSITPEELNELTNVYLVKVDEDFNHEVVVGTEEDLREAKSRIEVALDMPLTKDNAYAYAKRGLRCLNHTEKEELKKHIVLDLI